jgi:hypothetical protein
MTLSAGLRRRTAAVAIAIAALASAGGAVGVSRASASSRTPPCTKRALTDAMRRSHLRGRVLNDFRCAGRFAFAAVLFGEDEGTVLFRADGGVWETASRGKYCENGAVPTRIRRPACDSN